MLNRFFSVWESGATLGNLGRWYADPLNETQAQALLARAEDTRQSYLRAQRPCIVCYLVIMIAHYSLGRPVDRDYQLLRKRTAGTRHGRALTELVYGQLLMSRKLSGAREHLARGFELACHLFKAPDYFVVRKRHKLLSHLVLHSWPAPPAALRQLLAEAAAIKRLELSAGGNKLSRSGNRGPW